MRSLVLNLHHHLEFYKLGKSMKLINIGKCLNVHSVRTNFCLNVHGVCTNLCLNVHSPCLLCVLLNIWEMYLQICFLCLDVHSVIEKLSELQP